MSCQKEDCTSAKYTYTFSENKKIDTVRFDGFVLSTQVNSGTSTVFSYVGRGRSCPNWTDSPTSERLVFEIPAGVTNFSYSNTDLQGIECYHQYSSWTGSDAERVIQGVLKGNKISNNKWDIEVDLIVPVTGVELSFKKQFILQ